MANGEARLVAVMVAIDAANACDPTTIAVDGRQEPSELVFGRRMSETLDRLAPDASQHARIAARGFHVERWTIPRKSFPEGRAGYLNWRNTLKAFHANRIAGIMTVAGYDAGDIARVGALVRKERLKRDAEAQLLEDVACVVFLQHYLEDFRLKTDEDKLAEILAKTWRKMSEHGHDHALKLDLGPTIPLLLQRGLARLASS